MKRMIAAALALVLVLALLPVWNVSASAAAAPDLEALVAQQINACADSLYQANSDEDAALYFADHAVTKRGAALHADENHVVTACLYSSNLLRAALTDSCASLIETMQRLGMRSIYGKGGCSWRSYLNTYSMSAYLDAQMTTSEYLGSVASSKTRYSDAGYTGALNAHDETLLWTVGNSTITIDMTQASVSADTVTYNVTVVVSDRFDFDGNYENAKGNATFEKVVTLLGSALGKLMFKEYDWDSTVSFQLTVPNPCTHRSYDYRWEYDGTNLVSVTTNGNTENTLTRIQKELSDGTLGNPYYMTAEVVRLEHDLPWVLEFRMKGSRGFILSPGITYAQAGQPYLLKTADHFVGGEYFKYTATNEETGKEVTKGGRKQYGIEFSKYGYKSSAWHTYRLENRIAEDGSNMVWLLIDGNEIGPMNQHFLNLASVNVDQNIQQDWFNGTDIKINYLFNREFGFANSIAMEYIQIWENGENAQAHSYFEEMVAAPTCSAEGYTAHTCEHCGYTYKTDIVPTTEHSYAETVTPPSCTKDGYTTHTCTVCGDSYRTDPTSATGHRHMPTVTAPTCTAQGYTTYTCACGDSYAAEYVDATGHSFVDYVPDGNATCTEDGTKTAKCVSCDVTDTQPDPGSATGHHGGEANCYSKANCEACGIVYGEMDPANHAGGEEVRGYVEPQEFKQGFTGHTYCKGCGEKLVSGTLIPSTHVHSYGGWESDSEQHWQECACGDVAQKAVHVPGPEATATESQTCTVCGYEIAPAFGADAIKLGDVNGDGKINAKDATLILRYSVKKYSDYPVWFEQIADVNGDGRINAKDATLILRFVVGKADIPGWER